MSATFLPLFDNFTQSLAVQAATDVCRILQEKGFEAYFVGGCVRDALIFHESPPKDIDICTSAKPEDIKKIFLKTQFVGQAFGVCMVSHKQHGFEVATFRKEGAYSDKRHPDYVEAGTHYEDSIRRDFTMNALYFDPVQKKIVDFHSGQSDILKKQIRCVGNATLRLQEDALRIIRLFRFAARLGFQIEESTLVAANQEKSGLSVLSHERILMEIVKVPKGQLCAFTQSIEKAIGFEWLISGYQDSKSRAVCVEMRNHAQYPLSSFLFSITSAHNYNHNFLNHLANSFANWPVAREDAALLKFIGLQLKLFEHKSNNAEVALIQFVAQLKKLSNVEPHLLAQMLAMLLAPQSDYFGAEFYETALYRWISKIAQNLLLVEDASTDVASVIKLKKKDLELKPTEEIIKKVESLSLPKDSIANWVHFHDAFVLTNDAQLIALEGSEKFLSWISAR